MKSEKSVPFITR